jgi:hypothetical protein
MPTKLDFAYLFEKSELVFAGTLQSKLYDIDTTGLPWTLYTFTDLDIIAGRANGSDFSLRCPGGVYDGLYTDVGGVTPDLELGERALVFFDQDAWCQITAGNQGHFKIVPTFSDSGSEVEVLVNARGLGAVRVSNQGIVWGNKRVWRREFSEERIPQQPTADVHSRTSELSWASTRQQIRELGKRLYKKNVEAAEPTSIVGNEQEANYAPPPKESN